MTQFVGKTPIHPFPCPTCSSWPSCDMDDDYVAWRLRHLHYDSAEKWPIHLCDTHRLYATKIIALAQAAVFLPAAP